MQPFSITLFATTGDPEGIRHVDKSNWSGYGVVFTRELFHLLKQEPGISQAGVYILVGNAAEETIYIGEADPVGDRLKNHVANKEGWVWGVYFFDRNHKIGKTEVQFLESELVALAKKHGRAILLNKNSPTTPTMAPAARATAQAFLADMLLILPMLGINAFNAPKQSDTSGQVQAIETDSEKFDTIVVPAREEGFNRRYLGENCWFAVRINAKHIPKLKYIVAYQVAPVAAITHIAEIESIVPYNDTGKYMIHFKGAAKEIGPIPRPLDSEVNMQSPRYALRGKVLAAKNLDQVWAPIA
ncbi:GIY-YIG nuclease family protein [Burkholderia ubonensis]|uniref:GIY-YIG nuclease family protein n=1 Tax=Burkholderia ubonensis TaxID=101571 RepID=UPI002AB20AA4|nr:GIY-YIG nuclease family protein [Burkholderia ubonensis]